MYGCEIMRKKIQLTEQEERMQIENDPLIQTIIRLVEDEGLTAYAIDRYKKSEVPMNITTIAKIIKECEQYGYIDETKRKERIKLRRIQKIEQERGKKRTHYNFIQNGEEIPVMYESNEVMPLNEIKSIEQETLKLNGNNINIIEVVNQHISAGEYEEALKFVRARHQFNNITVSKEIEEKLKNLETSLVRACKTQTAIRMLNAGNNNIIAISELTGLSKEIVAILKMKLKKEKIKFVSLNTREKAISELLKYKSTYEIQQQFGINDVEIADIENQTRYRRMWKKEKQNFEVKVKQDSKTRIIVLATKLGIKEDSIAKELNLDVMTVENYLKDALKVDLIKENELHGINLLDYGISSKREIIK